MRHSCSRQTTTRGPLETSWPYASSLRPGRTSARLQTKLTLGKPGDAMELEADRVADAVMRAPGPFGTSVQRAPAVDLANRTARDERIQRSIDPIHQSEGRVVEEEDERPIAGGAIQAKEQAGQGPRLSPEAAAGVEALRGGGEALAPAVRSFMEPRFGHDFSRVRIHADDRAGTAAEALGARAFTFGQNIAFARGQYSPATEPGRWLLAHELTHVVQQDTAAAGPSPAAGHVARAAAERDTIRRVAWNPNTRTRRRSYPWRTGPVGWIRRAATDAGTPLDIWREDPPGATYWCHGYTFGGSTAAGGPYSIWGSDVPTVLRDDGWRPVYSCMARPEDILVFYDRVGQVTHTGIIRSVSGPSAIVDEGASTLQSKWGAGSLNTQSWSVNAASYGNYRAFSKSPAIGPCAAQGPHELP